MWPAGYWPSGHWHSGHWPKTGSLEPATIERGGFLPRKRRKDFAGERRARDQRRQVLEALFDRAAGVPGAEVRLLELLGDDRAETTADLNLAAAEVERLRREEETALILVL